MVSCLEEEVKFIIKKCDILIRENVDLMDFKDYNQLILSIREAKEILEESMEKNGG